MELTNLKCRFGSFASAFILVSSSSEISSSSNVSSIGMMELASIIKSYLVDGAPVLNKIGTSFITPTTLILQPGVVLCSIFGSTRSSWRNTESLFGWSPPSNSSGDSSRTSLWASTKSFEISLNLPLLPHVHLDGSLNFCSSCRIEIVFPHEGHSNFADVTWGLTSDDCLTMPSKNINLLI